MTLKALAPALLTFLFALTLACGPAPAADAPANGSAAPQQQPDATPTTAPAPAEASTAPAEARQAPDCDEGPGWEWCTATPEEVGLDPVALEEAAGALRALPGTRSLLVARRGRIVLEESFVSGDANRQRHDIKSASKSILSTLVGIAIDREILPGVEAPVSELLPELYREARGDEAGEETITLEHLLTMTSGLRSTSGDRYGAWVSTGHWARSALGEPREAAPGEAFLYSTGSSHLVGAVLTEATDRPLRELARDWLFEPLGIEGDRWSRSPEGYDLGGNGLSITPRDLARFGQLVLQDGRWQGEQVVSSSWLEQATRAHDAGWPDRYGKYGYLWWQPPTDPPVLAAIGYAGQVLALSRERDLLLVMTSDYAPKGAAWDRRAFEAMETVLEAATPSD